MTKINQVTVYLDQDVPAYMDGIVRCGSVTIEYIDGSEVDDETLIDNTEYHSHDELIDDIAKRLGVNTDIVSIEE
tara:strand:+ start:7590 stop:7814 length:225 start_codon:yes stop_codon:yes gene_type:complete